MTKNEFKDLIKEHPIYLDGATGSNLLKRGMPAGVCPEKWILEHRDVLIGLQKEFIEAGSNIIYAPTFTANSVKLKEYGLGDDIEWMNKELVAISKEAADGRCLVAADITMTGEQLSPMGTMDFEELIAIYKEQIGYLVSAGVDILAVETMMSLQESRAALIAAKEVCELPVIVTMTFEADGRTLYGTDAKTAAIVLESLGADAVGANCSTGPDKMAEVIRSMAEVTSIPIIAKPNAGLPYLDKDGNTVYDMNSDDFAAGMAMLVETGASILGGCCGTTPEYIEKLCTHTKAMEIKKRKKAEKRYLTSERQAVEFGLNDNFMIVGERINPTGKKKLQEQLRAGNMDMVMEFAEAQEACGAAILDINMGMSGINEKEMMLRALEEVGGVTNLPLAIDSSHVEVLEEALRRYPGRALVNSVSYESAKFESLLPIVKKYGAMFILLPVSDEGLPKNLEEKKEIIHKITKRAVALGMDKKDIVVDGLVATVGADKRAALETLQTIRYCKENGYATVCGLSNISFGLPQRGYINTAFLTMAIQEGLTMAIANPSQELLVCSAFAADLLLNKEEADIRYIELIGGIEEKKKKEEAPGENLSTVKREEKTSGNASIMDVIWEAVLKGNRKKITEYTISALEEGKTPQSILNDALLPAINEVGDLFDKGKYFLPQLISSAEAMKAAIEYLEPLLKEGNGKQEMPAVIIATVEGDIHDIGKNLVALMLKNYGFRVVDLGKDVPKEHIIQAAIEHNASVIALSALMTTTMQEMRKVISHAREQGVKAKVIIGGAVITQDYADEIGADGYSKDAADAVKLTKRILHISE
ncbi:homocysteine S-methyltransferase family protein [Kineothrix sp. MB12-C1]|uniref:homocysteine S-methyltransferase family protein n=1 Tax=Kineothrix sp. MB12-C1 TaxID=3070215 RepID=UPI0027D2C7D1|nr:homocysteine S-methyltransferase family protein [Kineothrix sp. MB12-C1]WMC92865.1 homocysteine S-methyltransferase family protein [Kineothrix sp. MB12-C1]